MILVIHFNELILPHASVRVTRNRPKSPDSHQLEEYSIPPPPLKYKMDDDFP